MLSAYVRAAVEYLFAPENRPRVTATLLGAKPQDTSPEQVHVAALLLGWRDPARVQHWVETSTHDSQPLLMAACWFHAVGITREEIDRRAAELAVGTGKPPLQ